MAYLALAAGHQVDRDALNALVFDKTGIGYFESFSSNELYEAVLDVAKPYYKALGTTGSYKSAGDLTFYSGVLAGFTGRSETRRKRRSPTQCEEWKVVATVPTDVELLHGHSTVGGNALYAFANTSLYRLYPSQKNIDRGRYCLKTSRAKD